MSLSRRAFTTVTLAFAGTRARAGGGEVLRVRLGDDGERTRLVLDVARTGERCDLTIEAMPTRVTIAVAGLDARRLAGAGRGLIAAWSLTPLAAGARLDVTLARSARVDRVFQLAPADPGGAWRIVLDLRVQPRLRVVLDPGHGGEDVGALGLISCEKDVTLAAALALRDSLMAGGRYEVALTRSDDRFVPLGQRRDAAQGADLFLSLHADASSDPAVRGASAYSISDAGVQRALARSTERWASTDPATSSLLADLGQRGVRNRSAAFAERLLTIIGQSEAPLLRRSHREAGFVVLMGLTAPAVLLEMGFMTNSEDEGRLNDPLRRSRLASCVREAVDTHLMGEAWASLGTRG
uniref:N-acetylmuramoyl-L-alanine amidase family protein n=1 Tax=uncultured Caulobacter sp. TaxID=158749 RepID=UPI0025D684C4|nr:N-acetylmuramoyl-L-alanine amidase [uncultured Caulobacter sp.]